MARVQFVETVTLPLGPGGSLVAVAGIGTTPIGINSADESETTQAPAYAARTGNTLAVSLATDSTGTVSYWLESGDYNIHFQDQQSPPRIASFVRGFNAAQIDTSSVIVGAQDLIQFTGDYKYSEQATDHGVRPDGSFEWLRIFSEADGGGRLMDHVLYQGLWVVLGGPVPDALGRFRIPNVSSRGLVASGASVATGLTARAVRTTFGVETVVLVNSQLPPHSHAYNGTTGSDSPDHVHYVPGGGTGGESGHTHANPGGNTNSIVFGSDASGNLALGAGSAFNGQTLRNTGGSTGHSHGTNPVESFGAGIPGNSTVGQRHAHAFSGVSDNGGSLGASSNGSGAAGGHSNLQPGYGANLFIKT
jgi:microcystin-dependent protein